ncbi:cytochrome P450 10-like [Gigantopelta aegis]|uniref:cytochrome P450 10-like n=1 Tax=Gigantopelta aegis TaxID=1735272 RepID=UPI001B88DD88|nr:cytochrome P450 10-like [Gigantopelta aegis]
MDSHTIHRIVKTICGARYEVIIKDLATRKHLVPSLSDTAPQLAVDATLPRTDFGVSNTPHKHMLLCQSGQKLPRLCEMISVVRNSIRNSVKQCASPKRARSKSSLAVCPFSEGSQDRGFMGSPEEGGADVDVERGPVVATVDEAFLGVDSDTVVSSERPFSEMPSPGGIRDIPIVGTLFHFKPFTDYTIPTLNRLFDDLHDRHGKIYRLRLPRWMVIIEDPEDMETVFRNEGQYPVRPPFDIYRTYARRRNLPPNVGHIDGEEWKRLRGRVQKKLLRKDSASRYITGQSRVVDELVSRLKNKAMTPQEINDIFFMFSIEAIALVCLDRRLGFLSDKIPPEHEVYLNAIKEYFSVLAYHLGSLPLYKWFPTPMYKRFESAADTASRFLGNQIRKALDDYVHLKKNETWKKSRLSFLQTLLDYGDLSVDEISSLMLDLMTGGTDSTAKVIQAILYQLALNPEKQNKLFEEIHSLIGHSGNLNTEDLDKLRYLKVCIKETYRLQFPTPIGTGRVLQTDLVLGGYKVPKGVTVMCNNPRLLKNPKYFPDAEEFIPERWSRNELGQRQSSIPAMAMKPFGFGTRSCIGQRFAETETLLAIAKIIQNFHVSVDRNVKEPEVIYTLFSTFSEPPQFIFTPRQDTSC